MNVWFNIDTVNRLYLFQKCCLENQISNFAD